MLLASNMCGIPSVRRIPPPAAYVCASLRATRRRSQIGIGGINQSLFAFTSDRLISTALALHMGGACEESATVPKRHSDAGQEGSHVRSRQVRRHGAGGDPR